MKGPLLKVKETKTSNIYCTVIYTICMHCHEFMGTKDGSGISGTSHGICNNCREEIILCP